MRFRGEMSFNKHDTGVDIHGERIRINPGVEYRCELVLNTLARRRQGMHLDELVDTINQDRDAFYSKGDIRYAATRLSKEGYVFLQSRDCWKIASRALAAWDRATRETI